MGKYTTQGNVTKKCGHAHKSIRTAQQCADRYNRDVRGYSVNCYGDRVVVRVDGEPLNYNEIRELDLILDYPD